MRIFVRRGSKESSGDVVFEAEKNLLTGEKAFKKQFGELTSLEGDLLLLASAIFAADRATPRGDGEEYSRVFELSVQIVNMARLQPLIRQVERVLRKLSNDAWRVELRQYDGKQEKLLGVTAKKGKTLLFSGGLDSLAAAIEFGAAPDSGLRLISHITHNPQTTGAQKSLVQLLSAKDIVLPHLQFLVSSRPVIPTAGLQHDIENSQRTRSFLFLVLAALTARRAGHREVLFMAENGQMAIHLPLTEGRIGARSTHTAHPDVLSEMQQFLQATLDLPICIVNPYVDKTKAEVIKPIWDRLPEAISVSTSCWKNSRLQGAATHCGTCIPCYIRRIAIETYGTDTTIYARDPWRENFSGMSPQDEARRNLADYSQFMVQISRSSEADLMAEWPELYSRNLNAQSAIEMYKRAATETRKVWGRYPALAALLT
ncbi:MAG: 7-cyano-7-deazaguanine synthase [Bryobacteraceae bacterium]